MFRFEALLCLQLRDKQALHIFVSPSLVTSQGRKDVILDRTDGSNCVSYQRVRFSHSCFYTLILINQYIIVIIRTPSSLREANTVPVANNIHKYSTLPIIDFEQTIDNGYCRHVYIGYKLEHSAVTYVALTLSIHTLKPIVHK